VADTDEEAHADPFLTAVTSAAQGDVVDDTPPRRRRWLMAPRRTLAQARLALPWREVEYCVLDYETTGLDLRTDDIVSFGAVIIKHGRIDLATAEYELVRPRRRSAVAAFTVHALPERNLTAGTTIEHCAAHLARCLTGRVLVAHAAWIEYPLTNRALRSRNLRYAGACVDTAALARRAGIAPAGQQTEPELEALARRLKLPVHTSHHALGDAMTTAQLFLALAARLEGTAPHADDLAVYPRASRCVTSAR